jgi:hypothetical protein
MSESVEIIRQNLERQENVAHELLKENIAVSVKEFEEINDSISIEVNEICNNIENVILNLRKLAAIEEEEIANLAEKI